MCQRFHEPYGSAAVSRQFVGSGERVTKYVEEPVTAGSIWFSRQWTRWSTPRARVQMSMLKKEIR